MTPYGIVYRESPYSLQESVALWQKKFGVLKLGSVMKINGIIAGIMALICVALLIFKVNPSYIMTLITLTVILVIGNYFILKFSYIKEITRTNFQNTDKQIVLFEDRIEYTTPISKGEYYYDELTLAHEKNGIITLIIDTASFPCSICAHEVKKGDYRKFSQILRQKMGAKYEFEGGYM